MATLKEQAKIYESAKVKNVAELDEVPLNFELHTTTAKDENDEEFTYHYIEVNNERYRVPGKVIGDIKAIVEEKPDCTKVKVVRKGTGLKTQYTVVSLD